MYPLSLAGWLLLSGAALSQTARPDEFLDTVRPVLVRNCAACHDAGNPKNRFHFLKANTAEDIESMRSLWHSVATQLRNRTMPPAETRLSEEDRFRIVTWVEDRLRQTACNAGAYAGSVPARRLNRREYHHTIRDLFGVDVPVSDLFPADEAGGEGFDTNGETLFLPPMMMERYLEAAQWIVDRAIITPSMNKVFPSYEMTPAKASETPGRPLLPGEQLTATMPLYVDGEYNLRVSIERPRDREVRIKVKVDGQPAGTLLYQKDANGGPTARAYLARLDRGVHTFTVAAEDHAVEFFSLTVEHKQQEPSPEKRVLHHRLFGVEPGQAPLAPRRTVQRLLARFLPKAFRRPVEPAEISRFLAMYDRAAERGDPYEERVKLALKSILVSPHFLFRIEESKAGAGMHPVDQYALASRLSYFLWSTMPDDELFRLAGQRRLQDPEELSRQVERMLDDPRSRSFAANFVGQWLGTKDVGGRVVPMLTELQHYYTPEVSADLREEPVLLFHHIVSENRSLLELLNSDYTFLTERLAKFYQVEQQVKGLQGNEFQKVSWPDGRRGGLLGLGAMLAMTSHYKQTSPVLRGAWVLETLFGTPVPSPPPEVPPLETGSRSEASQTMREKLMRHRADPACSACHNVMDPIGFGLENFDWMGRWREREANGRPVDSSGALASGEKFHSAAELRKALLTRKEEFLRHLALKVLGYALGRGMVDGDHCTVQRLVDAVKKDNHGSRTLIREVALSIPFRNTEAGGATEAPAPARRRPQRPKADK